MRAPAVVLALALVVSWALDEWRYRKFLKKAPWFWGTTPGSVRFLNNSIMLVDDKTGHQTWISPGSITFSGPGESVSLRSEAPPRPQSGVRRMHVGLGGGGKGGCDERAGLQIFINRTCDEYLADFEQAVEIAVEEDGTIQTRGIDQNDPRSIMRYKRY